MRAACRPGGPASARTAASTVRCRPSGAGPRPSDHGTTHGLRDARAGEVAEHDHARRPAPPARRSAHARAPVNPSVAPEVETSTSVLRSSRARNSARELEQRRGARQLGEAGPRRRRRGARRRRSGGSTGPGGRRSTVSARRRRARRVDAEGRAGRCGRRAASVVGDAVGERRVVGRCRARGSGTSWPSSSSELRSGVGRRTRARR